MPLSQKEVNRHRVEANYDYFTLYNIATFGSKHVLLPRTKQIREPKAGADTAEYGVLVVNDTGRHRWKLDTFEACERVAEAQQGRVVRLGGTVPSSWDVIHVDGDTGAASSVLAAVDDSGNIDFIPVERASGNPIFQREISLALEEMGYPRAIQYNSTRPTAKELFELHQRYANASIEDYAVAVMKHYEPLVTGVKATPRAISNFRSDQEKEDWYSTPAGQHWLREHSVPPIMAHTKKELLNGRVKGKADCK